MKSSVKNLISKVLKLVGKSIQKFKDSVFVYNITFPFRIFTIMALGFLFGIIIASWLPIGMINQFILLSIAGLFILVLLVNILLKNNYLALFVLIFLSLVLGVYYLNVKYSQYHPEFEIGEEKIYQGVVVSKPDNSGKKQKIVLEINGQRVLVYASKFPIYQSGDKLEVYAKIEKPEKIEDFDYPGYLMGQKIFVIIPNPERIETVDQSQNIKLILFRNLYNFSDKIGSVLKKALPEPQASLAAGLILGTKEDLPESLTLDLKKTGLSHIVALSGFNVTIIIIALSTILSATIGRKKTFWFGLGLVTLFVIMTGASPSVVRAGIFSMLIIFGQSILGRPGDRTNIMLLAAVLMSLQNPFIVRYDVGFQLSFLAFCGLIYISPYLKELFGKRRGYLIPANLRNILAETLSAQIAVLPIMIFQFKQISLIAPFTNILILWSIPLSMLYSSIVGMIGLIYMPLASIFANAAWPLLTYIIFGVEWMARIPFSSHVW